MTEMQRILYRKMVALTGATRWPSGRRITAQERRWLMQFAVANLVIRGDGNTDE